METLRVGAGFAGIAAVTLVLLIGQLRLDGAALLV